MYKRHLNQTHLLDASESFGGIELDNENEWVKLAKLIPWHEFEEEYDIHFPSKKRSAGDWVSDGIGDAVGQRTLCG